MDINFTTVQKRDGSEERILQITDAMLRFRNFSGRGDKFNREGDRNFSLLITDGETVEALRNDVNEYGASWNVKIKVREDEEPFMHMPVKVKFTNWGPNVYLKSGDNEAIKLTEETIGILDQISIASVDLDIRAYDDSINGRGFRSAYLQSMYVVQDVDRHEIYDRFANR